VLQRTNKLLIGKDISRDAEVIAGAVITTTTASTGLADGEIVVLDKYFKVLAAGATVSDTDVIYICQGTAETFDYTEEDGSSITNIRKLIMSDPIQGNLVKKWNGVSHVVKAEQIDTYTLDFTPVVGTEYLVRIVYSDMNEHPGQFTQTYRITATDATLATWVVAMNAKINAHSGRRVNSTTNTTTTLVLTGREIPGCCTALTDREEFRMVEFQSWINYVDSDGNWAEIDDTNPDPVRTVAVYGSGNWEQVRDIEKRALPYRGITNFTAYPVLSPTTNTVVDSTYDILTIEHDKSYVSPDNQYVKQAPLTTQIAFVVPSTGTQETDVLGQLNPWMASLPSAFANVAV